MHESITLTVELKQQLEAHAKRELPNECCGYITGQGSILNTVYEMTNLDASPEHFSFDPKEQFKVIKDARSNNEVPIVVYHSHPETPARLSNEDLRLLKDPTMVYLIISMADNNPDFKAYTINNGDVNSVEIKEVAAQ